MTPEYSFDETALKYREELEHHMKDYESILYLLIVSGFILFIFVVF